MFKVERIDRELDWVEENAMNTEELKQKLEKMCRNSVRLNIGGRAEHAVGGTRFGGVPDVPEDFVWPVYETDTYDDKEIKPRPLSFIAQFNCAEFAPLDTEGLLPKTGVLSFFYEVESMKWGFDPKDEGCARVFWFEDVSALSPARVPDNLDEDYRFPMLRITAESEPSYPNGEDFCLDPEPVLDWDAYEEALVELGAEDPDNASKLLGWPDQIQGNMTMECEFISRGYYLGSGWKEVSAEDRKYAEQTSQENWRLLFQLDTVESEEDDLELMFGDCGRLYFYIRKEDLLARRFERVWLILQCY